MRRPFATPVVSEAQRLHGVQNLFADSITNQGIQSPRDEYEWCSSLTFNRFTVYSSTSLDPANPQLGKYNEDIDESGGCQGWQILRFGAVLTALF
jgi:hypothetical protein